MANGDIFRKAGNEAIIGTALPLLLDESDVSERTAATRFIGAGNLARTLMSGEFGLHSEWERAAVGELIGRIVANVSRQGIDILPPEEA